MRVSATDQARGSCLCGGVRYRVRGELGPITVCHCSRCRKANGSAFQAVSQVAKIDFQLQSGQDLLAEYESSPDVFRVFCRVCARACHSLGSRPRRTAACSAQGRVRKCMPIHARAMTPRRARSGTALWVEPVRPPAGVARLDLTTSQALRHATPPSGRTDSTRTATQWMTRPTPLYSRRTAIPDVLRLRIGSLDTPVASRPALRIFTASKADWYDIRDDAPQYPTRPGEMLPPAQGQ